MRKPIFLFLLLFGLVAAVPPRACPQQHPFEAGVGVVYALGHAFILKAPEGWILDRESRGHSRSEPVFYPVGFTAKDSPMLIWAGSKRVEEGDCRVESFLEERARALSAPRGVGVKADRVDEWRVGRKGLRAEIYAFVSDPGGEPIWERVGCIRTASSVDYVVVHAKDKAFCERSLGAFASIVRSYIFFRGGPVYIP